jgi:hypothetical protein
VTGRPAPSSAAVRALSSGFTSCSNDTSGAYKKWLVVVRDYRRITDRTPVE